MEFLNLTTTQIRAAIIVGVALVAIGLGIYLVRQRTQIGSQATVACDYLRPTLILKSPTAGNLSLGQSFTVQVWLNTDYKDISAADFNISFPYSYLDQPSEFHHNNSSSRPFQFRIIPPGDVSTSDDGLLVNSLNHMKTEPDSVNLVTKVRYLAVNKSRTERNITTCYDDNSKLLGSFTLRVKDSLSLPASGQSVSIGLADVHLTAADQAAEVNSPGQVTLSYTILPFPTGTPTLTPTSTPTLIPTPTPTVTLTPTPTPTVTLTPTPTPTVTLTPTPTLFPCVPGDVKGADRDGCVDLHDYARWLHEFRKDPLYQNSTTADFYPECQPNVSAGGDGLININDYNVWLREYRAGHNQCP